MNEAEPEKVPVAPYKTEDVYENSEDKTGHKCTDSICIYFHRFFEMRVGCKSLPLKTELYFREWLASKDHP